MTTLLPRLTGLATLCTLALCGCATPDSKKQAKTARDEYVWVTPIGSNIPIRVKKGDVAGTADAGTSTINPDELDKAKFKGSVRDPSQ